MKKEEVIERMTLRPSRLFSWVMGNLVEWPGFEAARQETQTGRSNTPPRPVGGKIMD